MIRKVSDSERREFEQDFRENRPIKPAQKAAAKKKVATGVNQLDGNTEDKLKRGQLVPGARLDLHGLTAAAAHAALLAFLAGAQARGVRLALVVTGKGNPKSDDADFMRSRHGVLKEMVPRWLNERDFAAFSAGSRPAHIRHGGDGALYVYLRRPR